MRSKGRPTNQPTRSPNQPTNQAASQPASQAANQPSKVTAQCGLVNTSQKLLPQAQVPSKKTDPNVPSLQGCSGASQMQADTFRLSSPPQLPLAGVWHLFPFPPCVCRKPKASVPSLHENWWTLPGRRTALGRLWHALAEQHSALGRGMSHGFFWHDSRKSLGKPHAQPRKYMEYIESNNCRNNGTVPSTLLKSV